MMDIFAKDRLIERAAAMSPKFIEAIHSLRDCTVVTDIRSVGLMAAVDVAVDGVPGARGHEAQKRLYDAGLHLKSTGDALIIAPPMICEDQHLDEIVSKLRTVLKSL